MLPIAKRIQLETSTRNFSWERRAYLYIKLFVNFLLVVFIYHFVEYNRDWFKYGVVVSNVEIRKSM